MPPLVYRMQQLNKKRRLDATGRIQKRREWGEGGRPTSKNPPFYFGYSVSSRVELDMKMGDGRTEKEEREEGEREERKIKNDDAGKSF